MHSRSRTILCATGFALTIFTSAFLLFQVQPILGKYILPWFGGTPAVWSTSMVFFQTLLFGGYAYAHLLSRATPFGQLIIHWALLGAAVSMLPIAPPDAWKPTPGSEPTLLILSLLTATVGLPYFALASTGPLVQAWFSRAVPGKSPYRLYALSNVGSLLALVSYPFYFEPTFAVGQQAMIWTAGFVAFGVLSALCALWAWRGSREEAQAIRLERALARTGGRAAPAHAPPAEPIRSSRRLAWVALPAFASAMLLATTNHVCQDVAVIPLLWVIPLSLYLVSFIVTFDHERWYWRRFYAVAGLVTIGGASLVDQLITGGTTASFHFVQELSLYFAALFCLCMICHGELVRLKPEPRRLTEFYLLISAGGALGGLLVSLAAPAVFRTFFEWKLGLLGGGLIAALVLLDSRGDSAMLRRFQLAVPLLLLLFLGANYLPQLAGGGGQLHVNARNFYGTVTVIERNVDDPAQHLRQFYSGRIVHGLQFVAADRRGMPTAYFGPGSGVGRAFAHLHKQGPLPGREEIGTGISPSSTNTGKNTTGLGASPISSRPLRVGVVGLGVGCLAAYAERGDYFRFYEINPQVVEMAQRYFTYLSDCPAPFDIVLGDGRLSLEAEPPQEFDLLVLDAFAGDAVPTHLLTREALAAYRRHLSADGTLAFNVSNRYLDLYPVVSDLAREGHFQVLRTYSDGNEAFGQFPAQWLVLTRSAELIEAEPQAAAQGQWPARDIHPWTDAHTNLFEILK